MQYLYRCFCALGRILSKLQKKSKTWFFSIAFENMLVYNNNVMQHSFYNISLILFVFIFHKYIMHKKSRHQYYFFVKSVSDLL